MDANAAYTRKQALLFAERFQDVDVQWFEEPVSSDDLDGLRLLRDCAPAGMDIAAGEYDYDGLYFLRMLNHGAVDVLQADATRCGGVTGFLLAAFATPLPSHSLPTQHPLFTLHLPARPPAPYTWNTSMTTPSSKRNSSTARFHPNRESYPPKAPSPALVGNSAMPARANTGCNDHRQRFSALRLLEREALLKSLHDAKPFGAHEIWASIPVHRFWNLLVQDCAEVYYAHPWAWDEIGFGGPAYPRAYMRLENGEPEPWEVEEQRYEWDAPEWALSDRFEPAGGPRARAAGPGRDPLKSPIGGPFQSHDSAHRLGSMQRIDGAMRRYGEEEVDYVIVEVGAGGGVMLQRLARAGFRVVGFDAGPFWDTEKDWVSDEAGSHNLYWEDPRVIGGSEPLTLGSNNCGKGVGGGTVHWAAFTPRFHPSDFRVHTEDGVGADWPLTDLDLKPYYELMELEMPVAGPHFPWGDPHDDSYGPHPMGAVGNMLIKGCTTLGIRVSAGGPVAILSGSRDDRPHCIYRGFCIQGCKVGAKASTLITHVPDALAHGAEIRDRCMVSRIHVSPGRRVTGVSYFDPDGKERFQKARAVIVAGYSIETPRLLLNSACPGFENGLANSSGTVGRYLMAQAGNVILSRFEQPVRMYKAPPAHCMTEEFYETDHRRGFARSFGIQTVGPLPIAFAKEMMAAKGAWGWGLRRAMMDYNHWCAFGFLGEILPHQDNRVTVDANRDRYGLPVAKVTFGLFKKDKKLIAFGKDKTMEVMWAAGPTEVVQEPRYAHLVGAARAGSDPEHSVVDEFGRTHDVDNLLICDGSVMPTQGSANPGLTIQAFAARSADYLIAQGGRIFTVGKRNRDKPKIRHDLSPPSTWATAHAWGPCYGSAQ